MTASTLQFSTEYRNAMLDAEETVLGASPILKIATGAPPANCAAAPSGTILATLALPADAFGAADAGVKAKLGTWQDLTADAGGTAAHYRLYKADGVTCVEQGTVTVTGGGGDLTVDNAVFAAGQSFTIAAWSRTAPGA